MSSNSHPFKFASADGNQLCHRFAKDKLGFDPHDYVIEGVCHTLDGEDLLAITPTGSGKTSFMIVYLIIMCTLLKRPRDCPGTIHYPKNPVMIVEPKFMKAGLSALIINSDTVDIARQSRPSVNLWEAAAIPSVRVIILSPVAELGST
ncbi:hypothetical protein C8Q77DRAFT_1159977 [Trametes polyzona]|nr:hypothetical protein C8Q77DRAFT_1159977 [Trametes polyzona]